MVFFKGGGLTKAREIKKILENDEYSSIFMGIGSFRGDWEEGVRF